MKPVFHDPLTDFSPELDEAMNRLGERIGAALEMTPINSPIAYDGSLYVGLACDCGDTIAPGQTRCAVCEIVFSPVNARGAERVDE